MMNIMKHIYLQIMALLSVLQTLAPERNLMIHAAHFNHQLRGEESQRDEDFVSKWCADHNIPLTIGSGDVAQAAQEQWNKLTLDANEQLRRANHRAILAAGDARALARLACALYRRQQSLKAAGRRLRQSDEAVWRDAERLVSDEFAYALGEEPAEVVRRLRACG